MKLAFTSEETCLDSLLHTKGVTAEEHVGGFLFLFCIFCYGLDMDIPRGWIRGCSGPHPRFASFWVHWKGCNPSTSGAGYQICANFIWKRALSDNLVK